VSVSFDDLKRWDRDHLWHPFTQMAEHEPLIIERARGCMLIDIEGREYLDGVSSLWCNIHGHRHPKLDAAIRKQLEDVAHVTLLGMRIQRRSAGPATRRNRPRGLNHVFFSDDGATAVEVASRWPFSIGGNETTPSQSATKYLAWDNAYHGDTLGSVRRRRRSRFHEMFRRCSSIVSGCRRRTCIDCHRA